MNAHQNIQKNLTKNLLDIITLELLETRPMHGYEIMVTIRKNYGVNFGPSTIYPILTTLEKKQYLKCTWNMTGERPRKIYELTTDGKALLDYTANSLKAICRSFGKGIIQTPEINKEIEIYVP